nr:hypothetical protein [uncultured Cohaesibacter sp.]
MAFKTIMSPAVDAHYPLRIIDVFVKPGDAVNEDTKALLAETGAGRKIAIKCGYDGRIIQVPSADSILPSRQMLLIVETFDEEKNSNQAPEGAVSSSDLEQKEREEQLEKAQAASQAAYAQARGQKETVGSDASVSDDISEAQVADGVVQDNAAGAGAEESHHLAPENTASRGATGKRLALVAAGVVVVVGGLVFSSLNTEKGFNSAAQRLAAASKVTSTKAANSSQAVQKPKPVVTRPYPAAQDTDWAQLPKMKVSDSVYYSKAKNAEFMAMDFGSSAGSPRVYLAGRAGNQGMVTSYDFSSGKGFRNVRYVGSKPENAYILSNFLKSDWSTVFFSLKDKTKSVATYAYPHRKGSPKKIDFFKSGNKILHADRDGDLAALLVQNTDSLLESVVVLNNKGKTKQYNLPDAYETSVTSIFHSYKHIALDTQSKDGVTRGSVIVAGSTSFFIGTADGYSFGVDLEANSSGVTFKNGRGRGLIAAEMLPKGVFQKYGSAKDKNSFQLRGFNLTASEIDRYSKSAALGGFVHGMGHQRNADGTYRADAYLSWGLPNGKFLNRMFVRTDSAMAGGFVVRDMEFLRDGSLAVLLREFKDSAFSALILIDKNGQLKGRFNHSNVFLNDIESYRGTLYGVGYTVIDGVSYASAYQF